MDKTPNIRSFVAVAAVGAAVLGVSASAGARPQEIIFADVLNGIDPEGNSIRLVHPSGTGLRTLIPTGGGLRGLSVDAAAGLIYWTDVDNFVVRRARFDGTMQQDLVTTNVAFPSAIRLDIAAGKMYWGDQTTEELLRADLNGANIEILGGTPFFRGIALDSASGLIYWSTSHTASTGRILRSNLDGSGQLVAVPISGSSFKPGSIALDVTAGKIYWADGVTKFIRRSNLDGSGIEDLLNTQNIGPPRAIALDLAAGLIYWGQDVVDQDSDAFLFGEIRRMTLAGGFIETVVSGLGSVNDLALADVNVCFADFNGDGNVSVQDIFDFLAAYFSNDPFADFNRSGTVTVQDIFDYLAAYFAGCS